MFFLRVKQLGIPVEIKLKIFALQGQRLFALLQCCMFLFFEDGSAVVNGYIPVHTASPFKIWLRKVTVHFKPGISNNHKQGAPPPARQITVGGAHKSPLAT